MPGVKCYKGERWRVTMFFSQLECICINTPLNISWRVRPYPRFSSLIRVNAYNETNKQFRPFVSEGLNFFISTLLVRLGWIPWSVLGNLLILLWLAAWTGWNVDQVLSKYIALNEVLFIFCVFLRNEKMYFSFFPRLALNRWIGLHF